MENFQIQSDLDDSSDISVESKTQMVGMVVELLLKAFKDSTNKEINICVTKE